MTTRYICNDCGNNRPCGPLGPDPEFGDAPTNCPYDCAPPKWELVNDEPTSTLEKRRGKILNVKFGFSTTTRDRIGVIVVLGDTDAPIVWTSKTCQSRPGHLSAIDAMSTVVDAYALYQQCIDCTAEALMSYIADLLEQAGVLLVDGLIGKPVEMTCDGKILKSWRILTEVL
jgi:hypothetical protein